MHQFPLVIMPDGLSGSLRISLQRNAATDRKDSKGVAVVWVRLNCGPGLATVGHNCSSHQKYIMVNNFGKEYH